jgi:hypothetical protein
VLKPGGMLLAFSGTRTQHRMVCAIEDAGFEVRDQMAWTYATGFPKSLDVSKAIDAAAGAVRDAIRPVTNPARNGHGTDALGGGWQDKPMVTAPATDAAREWTGWGTALKPAWEPICVARKPLDGTVAENVQKWGTGGINVDAGRIPYAGTEDAAAAAAAAAEMRSVLPRSRGLNSGLNQQNIDAATYLEGAAGLGRWPANIIHDGSLEVTGLLGEAQRFFYCAKAARGEREAGCESLPARAGHEAVDCAEGALALNSPRAGAGRTAVEVRNFHPTVKPVDLMRYLVSLVAKPGALVLDPFAGSGTTGIGCVLAGVRFHGIEMGTDHACIAWHRITHWNNKRRG